MTKAEREEREYTSLFTDERYAKKAWKQFIGQSLQSDAVILPDVIDAKGNVSQSSVVYGAAYNSVKERLLKQDCDREPMKAEVLVEANIIRASFDTAVFNTILDRTAGKVKEEISVTAGAFEDLTDEELEVLANHRNNKLLAGAEGNGNT